MMTADELELKQEELDALLAVRNSLALGCLKHEPNYNEHMFIPSASDDAPRLFNMLSGGEIRTCGTIACIGGWMDVALKHRAPNSHIDRLNTVLSPMSDRPIDALFYPSSRIPWNELDTEMAVKAIDNFLEIGDPLWEEIYDAAKQSGQDT